MKPAIGKYSAFIHVAGAAAAAMLCMIFYLRAQPVDLQHHNLLLNALTQLQRDEALLGEEVMRLGYNLANDYDQMTAIASRLNSALREVRTGEAGSAVRKDAEFQRQLEVLDERLQVKFVALERFKSTNSILKNSLIYLPQLRDELEMSLQPGLSIHELLDQLIELVLLQNRNASALERGKLEDIILRLERNTSLVRAGRLRDEFKVLLKHARLIVNASAEMRGLQAKLSSPENGEGLSMAYRHYYDRQVMHVSEYRTYLLLAMLGLLGYAGFHFFRWREQSLIEQSNNLRLTAAVFESQEGMLVTDANNVILRANKAFSKITGYTAEETVGKKPSMLKSGRHDAAFYAAMWDSIRSTGFWEGEIWNRRKNGEIYPEHLTITSVWNAEGKIANYVATLTDITESKAAADEIRNLAFYDPLTRLPNRRLLLDRLQHALIACGRNGKQAALLFIDLDHFKTLNDTLGHDYGDMLLQQVAQRLSSVVRKSDTVARLGGDEFVVMLEYLGEEDIDTAEHAKVVGEKILATLNRPYQLGTHEHHSSPSIGVTIIKDASASVDELLKQADIAMYQSKASGRNALHFFDPQMQLSINTRVEQESELRDAIRLGQFALFYQIQVDGSGKPLGAEALVRWMHPHRGVVLPSSFIALAEDTGLNLPLGRWVLDTACAQLKAWQQHPAARDLVLTINVGPKLFRQAGFADQVRTAIARHGIKARQLKLELNESILANHAEATIATARALKDAGVLLSLDDFGTGYSSLQYLKMLPVDQIKIDQSFVRNIVTDNSDEAIVCSIISLAQRLNLSVIAEGVEQESQRQLLLKLGCKNFQGFLFGEPVPAAEFEAGLKIIRDENIADVSQNDL